MNPETYITTKCNINPSDDGTEEYVPTIFDTCPFGAKAVWLSFNQSGNIDVHQIKELYAEIIETLNTIRGNDRSEKSRLLSIAITEAQTAQMWAVKAITWQD